MSERDRLQLLVRCLDLTSLEGSETEEQVAELCRRGLRPDPDRPEEVPSVAAVVLYPAFVAIAARELADSGVHVASVAGFPVPNQPLEARLEEIRGAVDDGADEIDIVLNHSLFLSGRTEEAEAEIAAAKEACGNRPLKVILETGELEPLRIRDAALLAASAGADFVKSSTGKTAVGATPDAARAMVDAIVDYRQDSGRAVGIKVSGGVRSLEQALDYLAIVEEGLGEEWLTPERFRIGASRLLDELVTHLRRAS